MSDVPAAAARPAVPSVAGSTSFKAVLVAAGIALALAAAGTAMPKWLLFLVTMALSHGLAALGVTVLTRGGGATFGQGLFFAIGAYLAALAPPWLGTEDALVRVLFGAAGATIAGAIFAPLLARYRGIFFAMLTLALSMVAYGVLNKVTALGGSDGLNIGRPTLLGMTLTPERADYALFVLTVAITALASLAIALHFRSAAGLLSQAVRGNPLRVEYLGASARVSLGIAFVVSSALGGLGGAITGLVLGHVDPNFANWTTSGEFVFVAILAGHQSVIAVYVSAVLLELVRSFSSLYFPNTWQLALGAFLLAIILFRPRGIGSLWLDRRARA